MYIEIQGILGEESLKKIEGVIDKEKLNTSIIVFVSFSKFSIPLHYKFSYVFKKYDKSKKCKGTFELITVTNQLCKPLNEIAEGYKTICQINYGNNIEFVKSWVTKLPVVENWYEWDDIYILE